MSEFNKSIVIMGCKHCGKTTHGKALALQKNLPFFDTDEVMQTMNGMPVRNLYLTRGVSAFMRAEEEACKKIINENSDRQLIISTGGGICDNAPALNILRPAGLFVFLELDIEYSIQRVYSKIKPNPLGGFQNCPAYVMKEDPKSMNDIYAILKKRYEERFETYRNIADTIIRIRNTSVEDNFKIISEALR